MIIHGFRDLHVWQAGMSLVDEVFRHSRRMPFWASSLQRQMQRSAVSIPSNIAEGYRRKNRRGAYQNHISIAMGSQGELETQIEIALRNGLFEQRHCTEMLQLNERVRAMLIRLHDSLN